MLDVLEFFMLAAVFGAIALVLVVGIAHITHE